MPITHFEDQLSIPRGTTFFDPVDDNGQRTGEIDLGNCPGVTVTIDSEKAEHYTSRTAAGEKDRSITTRINRTGKLTCDNVSMPNYALWLAGTQQLITQDATPVVNELRTVRPGRFYQLGANDANPLGVRDVTAVTVKDEEDEPYKEGEDYELDATNGRIRIVEGGSIAEGDKVKFAYTPKAGTYLRVKTGGKSEVSGALRIVADNASGENRDFYMPKVTLSATGDLPLIVEGSSNEFVALEFSLEVLKAANAEAIYIDGRPRAE